MADSILIDYISTLLRTKGGGANLDHAASVLSSAASHIHLLDAQNVDNATAISELRSKAKSLAQSKSLAQKTAGMDALTVFSEQGSRAVFLANFVEWSTEALTALKTSSSQSEDTVNAAWRLMAAIFRRAGRLLHIPGVRRDAAPLANKLTAAITQAAAEEKTKTATTSELAFSALHAALLAVPSSFKPHVKTLEHVVSRAMLRSSGSNTTSTNSSTSAAVLAFAALPRAGGDASDWSAAAQRLFVSAHSLLDQVYLGLEPSGLVDNCRQGLDSTATILPGVLDSLSTASNVPNATGGMDSYALTFGQLEAILNVLEAQLTTTFPTPIPLPSSPILLLATRILSVDGDSVAERSAASTGKLAELCLRLPTLHSRALDLLATLTQVAGVQLTPLLLSVARTLADQLGKVAVDPEEVQTKPPPSVKISLYQATAVVLRAGGIAAARQLAPIILQCAYIELYGVAPPSEKGAHMLKTATRTIEAQPARKKAKHAKHRGDDFINLEVIDNAGSMYEFAALLSQSAFLGVLEALLDAGASLLTFGQRARADDIIAHAASTAADVALKSRHTAEGDASPLVSLQLASLKALLASVLAPASYRPPHVSLALSLFKSGVRHQAQAIAQFSSHALLCCEALMHPRSLPRPAPLKPADSDAGVLGMPRFWSFIDADAWLKFQQAQQQVVVVQDKIDFNQDMEIDGEKNGEKSKRKSTQKKSTAFSSGGFLSPRPQEEEKHEKKRKAENDAARPPGAAAETTAKRGAEAAPVLAPLPKIAPKVNPKPTKPAPPVSAPLRTTATTTAAADESDDESLPEIDSGASSSDED